MAFSFYEEDTPPIRECDHENCHEAGLYPAPKSKKNLKERYYFCLDHVREYNKKWNFFSELTEEQIYAQMHHDMLGERPTWPSSIPLKMEARLHEFIRKFTRDSGKTTASAPSPASREIVALQVLGLAPDADQKKVKARYRELVKKYHPDTNPDPKAVERFKTIAEAYMVLRMTWQTKQNEST